MRALAAHLKDIKRAWRWALALAGVKAAVLVVVVVAAGIAGEQLVRGADPAPAIWFGGVAGAAILIAIILSHLRNRLLERAALWVDHAISRDLLVDALASDVVPPRLFQDAGQQASALRVGLADGAVARLTDAAWTPLFALALVAVDWRAGVVAGLVIVIGYGLLMVGASGDAAANGAQESARADGFADQALRNAGLVRALMLEHSLIGGWAVSQSRAVAARYDQMTSRGRWQFAAHLFAAATISGAGALALAGVYDGAINRFDAAVAFGVIAWIAIGQAASIAYAPHLRELRSGWRTLVLASLTRARVATNVSGAIALDGVSFAYAGRRRNAIEQVSLIIQPGEVVAVSGYAGSGKSTLAAAIAGAIVPSKGTLQSGGLRIGYVPEMPLLLNGSVAQNISRFGSADLPGVIAAAERAGVRAIIEGLEAQFDTTVAAQGLTHMPSLTLREARAVTMARAVFAPVDLLVLDTPELGMDMRDMSAIMQALQRLREAGVGLVIASNDPRFLQMADRFVQLDHGRVINAGATPHRRGSQRIPGLVYDQRHAMAG